MVENLLFTFQNYHRILRYVVQICAGYLSLNISSIAAFLSICRHQYSGLTFDDWIEIFYLRNHSS